MSRSHRPDQENSDLSQEARASGSAKTPNSVSIQSVSEGRPCPFLGIREWSTTPHPRPSRDNVCYGQPRKQRKGFRKIRTPYSPVSRERQSATCLKSFSECSYYQTASSKAAEENEAKKTSRNSDSSGASRQAKSIIPSSTRKRKHKHPHSSSPPSRRPLSKRWRAAIQMGVVFMVCAISALALSLFLSTNPSSFFDYVVATIVRNDIKAFGMKHKGVKDRSTVGGLATGGNLRSGDTLSKTDKRKLKNSAAVRNLSQAQKERLKKQFGGK